tara:strand:+ start:201 stop:818 length:618 start_codon:yes stop_codon:yes gene_type:complete
MSDYRVKITIRNNRLLEALEKKGYTNKGKPSVRKFCNENNLAYIPTNLIFSGKESAINKFGKIKPGVQRVLDFLNLTVDEAFTNRQLKGFHKNSFEIKAKEKQLLQIADKQTMEIKLMQSQTDSIIDNIRTVVLLELGKRYEIVWDGINQGRTLQSIGDELKVSRERVRQMYGKIEQKIKNKVVFNKDKLIEAGAKEVYPKVNIH